MRIYTRFRSVFASLFRKAALDRDLDEELRSYLDMLTDEKVRAGMSPEAARREARLELGGVEQVKERVRERRLGANFDTLVQDIRYAVRTLSRNAGFSIVSVLILAIGIGANTALFSNIQSVLLRGIPFAEPDRLVTGQKTIGGQVTGTVSRIDYFDYREFSGSFEALAALANFTMEFTVTGGDRPELVDAAFVTWNLFATLGVNPISGRHFTPEEEAEDGAPVVLISYGLWQRRFGGSADAIGGTIDIDGSPIMVIGVMPHGFRFLFDADVWALIDRYGPFDGERDSHSHLVVGRLKPGVTIEEAQSEVDAISASLAEQYPATNAGKALLLTDLHRYIVRDVRLILLLLMATTALVLLIACGNVAGLLLARGERRHSEMAMRSALGASTRRLVRQLLTESVILTVVAGFFGVIIAYLFQDVLLRLLSVGELGIGRPAIDARALAFTLLLSVVTGLVVGVIPALRGATTQPARQLGSGARASAGLQSGRLRRGLVVLQVAISVALLVGSGLLIRSFAQLARVDLGFEPEGLLTGRLKIAVADYPTPQERSEFFASLLAEIEAQPGVVSAGLINRLPILSPFQDWGVWPAEAPEPTLQEGFSPMARWVSPDYFRTMGIPLLRGRDITSSDVDGTPYVVVLSESTARTVFGDADPIGRRVHVGWPEREFEVVGIVADARLTTARGAPDAAAYMSAAQLGATRLQIAVRTSMEPTSLAGTIESLVRSKNPNVLFAQAASMDSALTDRLADFRIVIVSIALFAGVALLLTAIGLYGVLAYHVGQRKSEFGVRRAMGASNGSLLGMVLKTGLVLVGVGLLLGLAVAYPGTLLVRQLLYETPPLDPATYVGAIGFLGLVAVLACLLPAWRATRVDVVAVLRME
jgi:predicted permease